VNITENDGEVLVVSDVLELGNDDAAGFLVIELVGFGCSE
jgi:hypothetical protein